MKKILMTCVAAVAFAVSGYTFHRSFRNGYPANSGPTRTTGASVGVNGARFSAQDGVTKKGKEKPKDDGTCWCMSPNGTRCKNRKDGEKDYCKMHAADRKVKVAKRHALQEPQGRREGLLQDACGRPQGEDLAHPLPRPHVRGHALHPRPRARLQLLQAARRSQKVNRDCG